MVWLAYYWDGDWEQLVFIGLFTEITKAFEAVDAHAKRKVDFPAAPASMPTEYSWDGYHVRCFEIDLDYANPPVDLADVVGRALADDEDNATLQLKPVASSNIAAIGYNKLTSVLRVKFLTGGVYDYSGVPPVVAEEFQEASSKGTYLSRFIRPRYAVRKLDAAE